MHSQTSPKKAFRLAGLIVALVSFIPFLRLLLSGQSLFFRDLSGQFFPARRFLLDGLGQGELRFWNPFVHEGVPVTLSPFGYLPDLLQLLIPSEFGFSLFLCLHVPLAAFSFTRLARELDLPETAAATGALIYALGGFSLSTLNLYVYIQTLAWVPLFILAFRRAVESGTGRAIALAAMALAMIISTTGIEVAIQGCILAAVLTPPSSRSRFLRSALSALLGIALAAAVILPLTGMAKDSVRGAGFATSVVLAHSVHPLGFLQVLIAGFFGDPSNLTGAWWGVNFFPRGFPYILSVYLGPAAVCLACVGAMSQRPLRRRLTVLALVAAAVCLGRYAGWEAFFDLSPALRFLRYPVKAFFTIQFSVALLASFAVAAFQDGSKTHLRRMAGLGLGAGGLMVGSMLLPTLTPRFTAWFLDGILPAGVSAGHRTLVARFVTGDAATSGAVAMLVGFLCLLASFGRILPSRAALAAAALVGADLLRAGAGLNPGVTAGFYELSPEMAGQAELMRRAGGRVFTCDPQSSPSYWAARRARAGQHEAFTMMAFQETLTPDFNVPFGVRTALSIDRTMLVPTVRVLSPELATCRAFEPLVASLRAASVTRVVSLEALDHAALTLLGEVTPVRIAPLKIRVYALSEALPRLSQPAEIVTDTPNHLSITVVAEEPATFIVREPFAPGWRATRNGRDAIIGRTASGHREIALERGRNEIDMTYEPSGLRMGLGITLVAFLICVGLLRSRERVVVGRPPAEAPAVLG